MNDIIGIETLKRMEKMGFYNKWLVGKVKDYLSGEILEIGCGIGNITELLVHYGKVTATDIERYYIAKTKKRMKGRALIGFGDAEMGIFFFGNKKFDVVINFNVNNDIIKFLSGIEIIEVIKHFGFLPISVSKRTST